MLGTTPGLTLEVLFDVADGESANEAKIEATRAVFRDLGLSENVEAREEAV